MYSNLPETAFSAARLYFVTFPNVEMTNFSTDYLIAKPETLHVIGRESDIQEQTSFIAFKGRDKLPEVLISPRADVGATQMWHSHRCMTDPMAAIKEELIRFCHNGFQLSCEIDLTHIPMELFSIGTEGFLKTHRFREEYGIAEHSNMFPRYNTGFIAGLYGIQSYCLKEATMVARGYGINDNRLPTSQGTLVIEDMKATTDHPPKLEKLMFIALP